MIYLLDTDTLIFMVRGLKVGNASARRRAHRWVQRCQETRAAGDLLGLSAVSVSELEFGERRSGRYDAEITAIRERLAPFELYEYDALRCPLHYGRIRHDLESKGLAIGARDLAAHAVVLDASVVTNNLAHFARVADFKTVNWLDP